MTGVEAVIHKSELMGDSIYKCSTMSFEVFRRESVDTGRENVVDMQVDRFVVAEFLYTLAAFRGRGTGGDGEFGDGGFFLLASKINEGLNFTLDSTECLELCRDGVLEKIEVHS